MCKKNPDYEPEIYQVAHYKGPLVDCWFTNGDVRRYDLSKWIAKGGCFAPLSSPKVMKQTITVYEGTLAFDLKGNRDPFEILDFEPQTVYDMGKSLI